MTSPFPRVGDSPISPSSRRNADQLPFSRYESSPRPGQPRQQLSRRSSAASSVGGQSEAASGAMGPSIVESGNNAISSLLMPPIVRTGLVPHTSGPSAPKPPTSRDIPPVTLTTVPHVDNSVFKSYLSQAGSLYDTFRQAQDGLDPAVQRAVRRDSGADETSTDRLGPGIQRKASGTSLNSADGSPSPQPRRRSSGGPGRRSALTAAPLSTIPQVYFDEDFHLENPRTFDVVSEKSEIARPPAGANGAAASPGSSGKKALAANAILQEKLSWYMDTVEIHLISSISTASTSFFAALGSLRELHAEALDSVEKIRTLRQDLTNLDESMAMGGLKILRKKRRLENARKLGDAMQQLDVVLKAVTYCEDMIEKGQVEGALEGLSNVERLIAGQPVNPRESWGEAIPKVPGRLTDLSGIKALEGAASDISFLRKRVGKAYEAKFIETLLRDLRSHVDGVPVTTTIQRWDRAATRLRGQQQHQRTLSEHPSYLSFPPEARAQLQAHVKGLARSDSIMSAAVAYRDAVLREIKNLIRRHLPSSSDDDAESTTSIATHESRALSSQEKSSILARNLRNLEPEDAEDMFKKVYTNVGEALRRLGTQVKVLLDITSSLESRNQVVKSPPQSPPAVNLRNALGSPVPSEQLRQEEIQQVLDLSNLLGQAVDIAQSQITKVLKVRAEQTKHLSPAFFVRYFALNRLFADECEAVSGRGGSALKNVVHDHIKAFVTSIAEQQRQKLVQKMDSDRWDAKDFTDEDSARLKRIMDASTHEVVEWAKVANLCTPAEEIEAAQANSAADSKAAQAPKDAPKEKARSAAIDEEKYILSESAIAVTRGIEAYESLLAGIPTMATELCTALLDYLKLFNSRSSQLILGAGATRSAGLKNITTRHLALSSQSLSFVGALVPYLREAARRYLPPQSALAAEFDKVRRLVHEHQSGIHDKLVEIMTGRAAAHVNAMKAVNWDDDKGKGADAVSPYMETLVKETSTLHKVLARHLPEPSVAGIMRPVMSSYRDQWGRAFATADIRTVKGKQRLIRDAEFFKARISKIDEAGDVGDQIYDAAKSRQVVGENGEEDEGKGDKKDGDGEAKDEKEEAKDGKKSMEAKQENGDEKDEAKKGKK